MTITLDLDERCWRCIDGKRPLIGPTSEPGPCPTCRGVGYVLGEDGAELIAFLKRHLCITTKAGS